MKQPNRIRLPQRAHVPGIPASPSVPITQRTDGKLDPRIRILLVDFKSGEQVCQHPVIAPWIEAGWRVRKAVPRIVRRGEPKLLVILETVDRDRHGAIGGSS